MKIKDGPNMSAEVGRYRALACDTDSEGYIENIDICIDGRIEYCINIQENDALGILFLMLLMATEVPR